MRPNAASFGSVSTRQAPWPAMPNSGAALLPRIAALSLSLMANPPDKILYFWSGSIRQARADFKFDWHHAPLWRRRNSEAKGRAVETIAHTMRSHLLPLFFVRPCGGGSNSIRYRDAIRHDGSALAGGRRVGGAGFGSLKSLSGYLVLPFCCM